MDFHKLNQVVTLFVAAVPNVVPLLKQINTSPGTGNIAIDLVSVFSPFLSMRATRSSLLLAVKGNTTPSLSLLGVYQLFSPML